MKVSAIITLKKDVLDPQGKVIHQTLDGMGFKDINEVRQGKYFEIDVKENDPNKAKEIVEEMCKKLLANLVIENYKIIGTCLLYTSPSPRDMRRSRMPSSA